MIIVKFLNHETRDVDVFHYEESEHGAWDDATPYELFGIYGDFVISAYDLNRSEIIYEADSEELKNELEYYDKVLRYFA